MGKIVMGNYSEFKSRKATAKCSDEAFYRFVSDLRNFERLAGGSLSDWKADATACSFSVSPAGKVNVVLASAQPSSKVQYEANTSLTGKITLDVLIEHVNDVSSDITLTFGLELSPVLRMMIASSAEGYLEKLVQAIEGFEDYN